MQSKRRLLHVVHLTGLIECGKDQPQTIGLIPSNPAAVVLFKEVPQALVFEALYYSSTVKRQLTFVNTKAQEHKGGEGSVVSPISISLYSLDSISPTG
jgi:hypothetical protein